MSKVGNHLVLTKLENLMEWYGTLFCGLDGIAGHYMIESNSMTFIPEQATSVPAVDSLGSPHEQDPYQSIGQSMGLLVWHPKYMNQLQSWMKWTGFRP